MSPSDVCAHSQRAKYSPQGVLRILMFFGLAFVSGCVSSDSQLETQLCSNVTCGGFGVCRVAASEATCMCDAGFSVDERNPLNCVSASPADAIDGGNDETDGGSDDESALNETANTAGADQPSETGGEIGEAEMASLEPTAGYDNAERSAGSEASAGALEGGEGEAESGGADLADQGAGNDYAGLAGANDTDGSQGGAIPVDPCPEISCDLDCSNGLAEDENGCSTCACNAEPPRDECRRDNECAPGETCVVLCVEPPLECLPMREPDEVPARLPNDNCNVFSGCFGVCEPNEDCPTEAQYCQAECDRPRGALTVMEAPTCDTSNFECECGPPACPSEQTYCEAECSGREPVAISPGCDRFECECDESTCVAHNCNLDCPTGLATDPNGCEICQCNAPAPPRSCDAHADCEAGERCELVCSEPNDDCLPSPNTGFRRAEPELEEDCDSQVDCAGTCQPIPCPDEATHCIAECAGTVQVNPSCDVSEFECQCDEPECIEPVCNLFCNDGYALGRDGCPICACRGGNPGDRPGGRPRSETP